VTADEVRQRLIAWNEKRTAFENRKEDEQEQLQKEFVALAKQGAKVKVRFKEITELAGISRNTGYSYIEKEAKK
jgi:response regulator of citrate/malate metabolism